MGLPGDSVGAHEKARAAARAHESTLVPAGRATAAVVPKNRGAIVQRLRLVETQPYRAVTPAACFVQAGTHADHFHTFTNRSVGFCLGNLG